MKNSLFPKLSIASIAVTVFLLSACGNSEPTEAEMFEAMAASDQNRMMFGDPAKMSEEFKKAACEKVGEVTYKCGIASRDGKGMVLPMSFTRVDDRWQLSL